MTPDEHRAEAERLLAITRRGVISGAPIGFNTHVEVAGLALVHATLAALPPRFEDVNAPLHVKADADAVLATVREPLTEEPATGPVWDADGDEWYRNGDYWFLRKSKMPRRPARTWEHVSDYAPLYSSPPTREEPA